MVGLGIIEMRIVVVDSRASSWWRRLGHRLTGFAVGSPVVARSPRGTLLTRVPVGGRHRGRSWRRGIVVMRRRLGFLAFLWHRLVQGPGVLRLCVARSR